ncbi:formate transporter FocA [Shewanella sp. HN-41]|uniref:formate transporter FocA n=1 Tax=Shewanella sp. HN-41 TaxID=327275 RepID=UPI0002125801|nr:formate transporter FocA [Shewanella sp. HN-41]EGM69406.1 formate efflux transporter [Shewanella sp. HN-41]
MKASHYDARMGAPRHLNPALVSTQGQRGKSDADKPSLYQQAEYYGQSKIVKSVWQSFGLAAFAGAFIALAFVFYITVTTGAAGSAWGLVRLVGGLAFSLGLMLVVICGGELFTSTVLSSVAWAQRRVTSKQLGMCWGRVYLGNLLGAMLMLLLIMSARMYQLDGGLWGLNALTIAQHKLHHSWLQAFSLGILCNMLVCLGVWMTFASRDALTKAILLMLPVAMFVSSGFEHSIANLFMVPLGIAIHTFAEPSFFTSIGVEASQFNDLTISHFILNNLIPVTLGNIVGGGILVGLGYWWIEQAKGTHTPNIDHPKLTLVNPLAHPSTTCPVSCTAMSTQCQPANIFEPYIQTVSTGEQSIMLNAKVTSKPIPKMRVSDVMDPAPITLNADQSVYFGLKVLSEAQVRCAPVVDNKHALVGFISQQDLLRSLWAQEFTRGVPDKVGDLMQTEVLTVSPKDPLDALIELMVVDRQKLFPVTDTGLMLASSYQSYEERLRHASSSRPSAYPVIEQGQLCGMINREHIAKVVCEAFYD